MYQNLVMEARVVVVAIASVAASAANRRSQGPDVIIGMRHFILYQESKIDILREGIPTGAKMSQALYPVSIFSLKNYEHQTWRLWDPLRGFFYSCCSVFVMAVM